MNQITLVRYDAYKQGYLCASRQNNFKFGPIGLLISKLLVGECIPLYCNCFRDLVFSDKSSFVKYIAPFNSKLTTSAFGIGDVHT